MYCSVTLPALKDEGDKPFLFYTHSQDGRLTTALVVSAYLLFLNTFTNPLLPLRLFTFKRSLDIQPITAAPSQLRYSGIILSLLEGIGTNLSWLNSSLVCLYK